MSRGQLCLTKWIFIVEKMCGLCEIEINVCHWMRCILLHIFFLNLIDWSCFWFATFFQCIWSSWNTFQCKNVPNDFRAIIINFDNKNNVQTRKIGYELDMCQSHINYLDGTNCLFVCLFRRINTNNFDIIITIRLDTFTHKQIHDKRQQTRAMKTMQIKEITDKQTHSQIAHEKSVKRRRRRHKFKYVCCVYIGVK